MDEIWKPIDKLSGEYEVSNLGRIRSTHKVIVKENGQRYTRVSKILKPATDARGYLRVACSFNGQLITFKVHRLVAEAFIPNPEGKATVNHKKGLKSDNRATELEWATQEEQTDHAIREGLIKMEYSEEERRKSVNKVIKAGSLNGFSKLNEQKVEEIRSKYRPTIYTRKMLAEEYGVSEACIKDIVNKRRWNSVT